jgi:hypothetical protein
MKNLSSLTKAQLVELIQESERVLSTAIQDAKEASNAYSTELPSKLAFEVGYLNGRIKQVLGTIEAYRETL